MLKRAFDILVSLVALVLLAPLLFVIAVVVKCTSRGPVLFRQLRVGRGFVSFKILKFRSMVPGAPARGRAITAAGDPRITPVGRWLRRWKLDELPQLVNVLVGEMSLVGPRPEVPKYVDEFYDDYEVLLSVRPGITDPASLAFRDEEGLLAAAADPEALYVGEILPTKIAISKRYVAEASLATDLRVLAATAARVVGRGEG